MTTGKKAFEGKSQASLIGAILEREPTPISSLQPMSPPALDRVVKKCLAKDPDGRWHSAHDLRDELQWIAEAGAQVGVPTSPPAVPQPAGWRRAMPLALGMLIIGSLMTGLAVWMLTQPASPPITRFSVVLPPDQQLTNRPWRNVALSPDGTHLAYVANQQLYLRAMDQLQATPLRGTDGGSGWALGQIVAQSLETGERYVLVDGGTDARYLPTGHLVYTQGGTLFAVPFDVARLEVTGGPVSLVDGVEGHGVSGAAQFSVSRTGSLVYMPGTTSGAAQRTLVWVDREGREEPLSLPTGDYVWPRVST